MPSRGSVQTVTDNRWMCAHLGRLSLLRFFASTAAILTLRTKLMRYAEAAAYRGLHAARLWASQTQLPNRSPRPVWHSARA